MSSKIRTKLPKKYGNGREKFLFYNASAAVKWGLAGYGSRFIRPIRREEGAMWLSETDVSGHRIGTAEVENAINMHTNVVESAVVGYPHDIKGQGIYAFVLFQGYEDDPMLGHPAQNPNLPPDHPESNVSSVSLHNGEVYPR